MNQPQQPAAAAWVRDLGAVVLGVIIPALSWLKEDKQFALVVTFAGVVAIFMYVIIRQEAAKSLKQDKQIEALESEVAKCEQDRARDISRSDARFNALQANQNNLWRDYVLAAWDRSTGTWVNDAALNLQIYVPAPPAKPPMTERRGHKRSKAP